MASKGGAPAHPVWYYNLKDNSGPIEIQDGPAPAEYDVREISGDERATWWRARLRRSRPYAEYQAKTEHARFPSSSPRRVTDSAGDGDPR